MLPVATSVIATSTNLDLSGFWAANFWGLLGSVTGVMGLIIAYLNWRYSKPSIVITKAIFRTRKFDDEFLRDGYKTTSDLRNHLVYFYLDIELTNRRGGPGSIEKPDLIFANSNYPHEKIIEIEARTGHYVASNTSASNMSHGWDYVDEGAVYNLAAGQMLDDTLTYEVEGSSGDLTKLIEKYNQGSFEIRYRTNHGKLCSLPLNLVLTDH